MFEDGGFESLFGGGIPDKLSVSSGPALSSARTSTAVTFGSDFNVNSGANSFERIAQMALPLLIVGGALWLVMRRR